MQIQNKLKKKPRLKKCYMVIRCAVYNAVLEPMNKCQQLLRKYGISKRYKYLRKFKNIHQSERCFIVATGPSLTKEDYLKIRNEWTIGVNAICKWFNETGVNTNYVVIADPRAYKSLYNYLPRDESVFIPDRKGIISNENSFIRFPIDISVNYKIPPIPSHISEDLEVCAYNGNTVVFLAIQIAIYMGFKEIYLIGTDCNYSGDPSTWYSVNHNIIDVNNDTAAIRMIGDYNVAKREMSKYDVRIFNATRGGMLEVFDRVSVEDVLEKNNDLFN